MTPRLRRRTLPLQTLSAVFSVYPRLCYPPRYIVSIEVKQIIGYYSFPIAQFTAVKSQAQ